jgi:hypothetical protein
MPKQKIIEPEFAKAMFNLLQHPQKPDPETSSG